MPDIILIKTPVPITVVEAVAAGHYIPDIVFCIFIKVIRVAGNDGFDRIPDKQLMELFAARIPGSVLGIGYDRMMGKYENRGGIFVDLKVFSKLSCLLRRHLPALIYYVK